MFWANNLYFNCGDGYLTMYVYLNSLKCPLKVYFTLCKLYLNKSGKKINKRKILWRAIFFFPTHFLGHYFLKSILVVLALGTPDQLN